MSEAHVNGVSGLSKAIYAYLQQNPKMRTLILIIVICTAYGFLVITESNNNPLRRIYGAEPYVWPKGCSAQIYHDAIATSKREGGFVYLPCACADPAYEVQDWYDRGLRSYGKYSWSKKRYYRIENDAVSINRRGGWTGHPICYSKSMSEDFNRGRKFFILKRYRTP